jgi:gliding motility-associated-like protein
MRKIFYLISFAIALFHGNSVFGQLCDPSTPVFTANLSGNPNGTWISPSISRDGLCCSATPPDVCIEFILTLDSAAKGISFNIASGAIPPGALYYQVECGPPIEVGQPICLNGAGPHHLTFCKPGNNPNSYSITSLSQPVVTATINDVPSPNCSAILSAQGLADEDITWTSVPPNALYNSYLSCPSGCDSTIVTPTGSFPPYVDYMVCSNALAPCASGIVCDTVRVYFITDVTVTVSPTNVTLCNGVTTTAITATATGGSGAYQYLWSNGQTTPTINAGAGSYTVTVSDTAVCAPAKGNTVINVMPPIVANAGSDVTVCANQAAVNLNGTIQTATAAIWKGGSGTFNPNNATLNATYTPSASEIANGFADLILETTNNQGCPADYDTIHITIVQPPSPSISGNTVACVNSTNNYSAALSAGCSYSWSVTGGVINGSSNSNSVSITWGNYSSGIVILTVTNGAGCSVTVSQNISLVVLPNPAVTGNNSVCQYSTSTYTINSSPGSSYTWTVQNGNIVGSNSNSSLQVNWSSYGSGSVTVVETNSFGCTQSYTMPITIAPEPVATISGNTTGCVSSLTETYASPFVNNTTYTWSVTGGVINGTVNSNSVSVTWGGGSGTITVTMTNSSGCSATATQNVSLAPLPNPIVTGNNSVCQYTSGIYSISSSSGSTYAWTAVNGTIVGSNTNSSVQVNWNSNGNGNIKVVETNSFGCIQSFTMPVTVFQQPVAAISGSNAVCLNNSTITYTSPVYSNTTYSWSVNGGTLISTNGTNSVNVVWNTSGSNYISLTVSNSSGCDSSIVLPVTVSSVNPPSIQSSGLNGCPPLSVVFSGNEPASGQTYSWTFGDQLYSSSANPTHVYNESGFYNVAVITQNSGGCVDSASATVHVYDVPLAAFSHNFEDITYFIGESILEVINTTVGGTSYFWSFGTGDTAKVFEPSNTYEEPGDYLIQLLTRNSAGCPDTASKEIRVRNKEFIHVPNAFTPNGDNMNDYFSILTTNIETASVSIFNRWGQNFFSSDDKNFKWDGTSNGEPVELGVYVYKIKALGEGGKSYSLIGTVTLVR